MSLGLNPADVRLEHAILYYEKVIKNGENS